VDDEGRVWSHSPFTDFNRYDGQNVNALIDALQALVSDDDFMLANSPFSRILQDWATLADITITAKSGRLSHEYGDYYNYTFTVNEVLSERLSEQYTADDIDRLGATDTIEVSTDEHGAIDFVPGVRYLVFLDYYEGTFFANPLMVAKIENGLSITAIPANDSNSFLGESVFTPYNGYTVAEIKNLVSRINSWQESHPD
jgi:hypothetical protein